MGDLRRAIRLWSVASIFLPVATLAQAKWDVADANTRRLEPSAFRSLPPTIREALESRHCTIPQMWADSALNNVVKGHFVSPRSIDWAVLCSVDRMSRVLVFVNQRADSTLEVALSADRSFLQEVGGGKIGFSRGLAGITVNEIGKYLRNECRHAPRHDGISDAFVEKASTVWYWCSGKWLALPGAD